MCAKNLCRAESSHKKQNTHPIDLAAPKPDGKGVSTINLPPLPHSRLSCRHHCSSQNHSNLVQAFQLLVDRWLTADVVPLQVLDRDIQQSKAGQNWMVNQEDKTSVTIALGLNTGGVSPHQSGGQKYSFWPIALYAMWVCSSMWIKK